MKDVKFFSCILLAFYIFMILAPGYEKYSKYSKEVDPLRSYISSLQDVVDDRSFTVEYRYTCEEVIRGKEIELGLIKSKPEHRYIIWKTGAICLIFGLLLFFSFAYEPKIKVVSEQST